MDLIGTIKERLNYDECSGYDNPQIILVLDDGTELEIEEEYLESHILFKDFRDKRVRILVEEIGEADE